MKLEKISARSEKPEKKKKIHQDVLSHTLTKGGGGGRLSYLQRKGVEKQKKWLILGECNQSNGGSMPQEGERLFSVHHP